MYLKQGDHAFGDIWGLKVHSTDKRMPVLLQILGILETDSDICLMVKQSLKAKIHEIHFVPGSVGKHLKLVVI